MFNYQHILAPIDLSDSSNPVIQRARELAEHYDARLTLLHVVENIPLGAEPFGEPSSLMMNEELHQQQLRNANQKMQTLTTPFSLPLNVEQTIKEGFTTSTILEFANHKQIDLIVIAHSGKKGFLGFLGSTADAIVKSADCDVLVVKHQLY
ncbi:universal stress protein [Thiothrix lacustris]|uniref:universal stress protein n=1 Tax=Thiothrix lacustris TaxID=525917 RepID=UPI0027E55BAE|nr:universal stress protein [Thiothrix lacustris]WMP18535.1 universal stress protein [Thiothrix lacustris]